VTKKRKYLNKTVHGRLRNAQAHLSSMHSERDLGRNIDSSSQTLNQYIDCSLGDLCDILLDDGRRAHALPRRVVEKSTRLRVVGSFGLKGVKQ
jgi:hypothetical protein